VNAGYTSGRSKSCAMPRFGKAGPQADVIAAASWKLFQGASDTIPCSQLSISATEFADAPVSEGKSIARFFGAAPSQGLQDTGRGSTQGTLEGIEGSIAEQKVRSSGGTSVPPAFGGLQQQRSKLRGTIEHSFARRPVTVEGSRSDAAGRGSELPSSVDISSQRPPSLGSRPAQPSVIALWTRQQITTDPEHGKRGEPSAPGLQPGSESRAGGSGNVHSALPDPTFWLGEPSVRMSGADVPAGSAAAHIENVTTPVNDSEDVEGLVTEGVAVRPAGCCTDGGLSVGRQQQEGTDKSGVSSPPSAKSAAAPIDLAEIDLIEQERILRSIKSANRVGGSAAARARGTKRRGTGRHGSIGKKSQNDPRQTSLSRFMGT